MNKILNKLFTSILIIVISLALMPVQFASAAPSELFFSEYIEGSGNNKAVEIYNGTGSSANLSEYVLELYSNGSPTVSQSIILSTVAASLASDDVLVLAHGSANAAILASADGTSNAVINFNGDDAVVLRHNSTVIDAIGQVGTDPGTQWANSGVSTLNQTLRRKDIICSGDSNGSDAFDPSMEWDGFAQDTFGGLGSHTTDCDAGDAAPEVDSTYPVDGATDFPIAANLQVTFSEPVDLSSTWFDLSCSTSGVVTATVSGGPAS
jgi:predicted extracellular nuclease